MLDLQCIYMLLLIYRNVTIEVTQWCNTVTLVMPSTPARILCRQFFAYRQHLFCAKDCSVHQGILSMKCNVCHQKTAVQNAAHPLN